MFNINLYLIILILFGIFVVYQIYCYTKQLNENKMLIQKIESFENTLDNIEKKEYTLDDSSLEVLMQDFDNFKNKI